MTVWIFIVISPLSRYDLNNVEKDVKDGIIGMTVKNKNGDTQKMPQSQPFRGTGRHEEK